MKLTQKENVFINDGKTLATIMTYRPKKLKIGKSKLLYVLRAGRKGTGKILARERCVFLAWAQSEAIRKMKQKVGGIEFMNENNIEKFFAANYIPDPYER